MNTNAELLKELRIDRKAAPPPSRRGLWIALAVVAVLLIVAGAAWAILGRDRGIEVQTATVQAIGGSSGSASVLDATGYVVARRMATVSAKITGKVLRSEAHTSELPSLMSISYAVFCLKKQTTS